MKFVSTAMLIFGLLLLSNSLFAHPELDEYEGAATCAECHSGYIFDAQEVAETFLTSVHGAFWTEVTEGFGIYDQNENPVTGNYGKTNRYCGLPGSITHINWIGLMQVGNPNFPEGIPGGCARCHPSDASFKTASIVPGQAVPADIWEGVDCMLCHAETYKVNGQTLVNAGTRRPVTDVSSPTGFRIMLPSDDDLTESSASISAEVTTNACQRCHLYAGGGYINKRGHDFAQDDVHAASMGCTDCHPVMDHKIGMGRSKPACWTNELNGHPENDQVSCSYCHLEAGIGPEPEHTGFPSNHFDAIACETCHITDVKGLVNKHFDQIKQVLSNGLFKQWTFEAQKITDTAILPDYHWYNGTVYDNVSPRGSLGDGKIYPFKTMEAYVPVDAATGIMLPIKLGKIFGADSTLSNYDGDTLAVVDDAIRTGVKLAATAQPGDYGALVDTAGNYTADYEWHWDTMVMALNHGIDPAEDAYTCFDCHAEGIGIMPWTELGYSENPYPMGVKELPDDGMPNEYRLNQNFPNPFNPSTSIQFSIAETGRVDLAVYDVTGKLVEELFAGNLDAGSYQYSFHGDDLASGVYFYKLNTENYNETRKMVLMK
jgi:hypothetical protein